MERNFRTFGYSGAAFPLACVARLSSQCDPVRFVRHGTVDSGTGHGAAGHRLGAPSTPSVLPGCAGLPPRREAMRAAQPRRRDLLHPSRALVALARWAGEPPVRRPRGARDAEHTHPVARTRPDFLSVEVQRRGWSE